MKEFPEIEPSVEKERKATAIAPANIALIKYWGKREGNLPYTDTISFNLSNCVTTTTVIYKPELKEDVVVIDSFASDNSPNDFVFLID